MAGIEDDFNGHINGSEDILEQDAPQEPLLKKHIMESDLVAADALKGAGASLDAAYAIRNAVEGLSSSNADGKLSQALRVKKLAPHAILPSRGSASAAGYDLSSAYEAVVPARGKALVKTELSIAIPEGHYARIAPRSGLAWKYAIDVGAGVIDFDYRGPVGVILFNHSDTDFSIKHGDRIAQLILEKISTPEVIEVDDLDSTARGIGGFGSTGVSLESNSTVTVTVEETIIQ